MKSQQPLKSQLLPKSRSTEIAINTNKLIILTVLTLFSNMHQKTTNDNSGKSKAS